jgi:hypothetical protein
MRSKYSLPRIKCNYCYISKDLKKVIDKHKKKLQKEENIKNGKKSRIVTFSFASKDIVRERKWF